MLGTCLDSRPQISSKLVCVPKRVFFCLPTRDFESQLFYANECVPNKICYIFEPKNNCLG